MKQQHHGLNVFDSVEAQSTDLGVDSVSPSTQDSSVTAPPSPHRRLLDSDRSHVEFT